MRTSSIDKADKLGLLLKRRREDLEGTPNAIQQIDIAIALDFTQSYVSRLEAGGLEHTVKKWRGDRVYQLLKAYRFNPKEMRAIAERFELALDIDGPSMMVYPDWVEFPIYHAASAGTGEPDITEGETGAVPKSDLRGIRNEAVMVVRVNGDCLVSQGVRFSARNIAPGDYVAINTEAVPSDKDIVAYWDAREGMLIVKYYKEDTRNGVLLLHDARGVTVPVPFVEGDLIFRGVVFYRGGSF